MRELSTEQSLHDSLPSRAPADQGAGSREQGSMEGKRFNSPSTPTSSTSTRDPATVDVDGRNPSTVPATPDPWTRPLLSERLVAERDSARRWAVELEQRANVAPTREELREWFGNAAWDDASDERIADIAEMCRVSKFEDLWQEAEQRAERAEQALRDVAALVADSGVRIMSDGIPSYFALDSSQVKALVDAALAPVVPVAADPTEAQQ